MNIILASQSPRRLELMHFLTDDFLVIPSDFDERKVAYLGDPGAYCQELALQKALVVARDYPEDIILGSDTIVLIGSDVLNKPEDRSEARQMIEALQGKDHEVLTAYAIIIAQRKIRIVDYVATQVTFAAMSPADIEDYLDEADYLGKAGAYAIQGAAAKYVQSIRGDFYTVVGLPVARLYKELKGLGVLK